MNTCLNLVVLRSPDIDRAVAFYRALGLSLVKHSHGKGPEHYSAESEGGVFELYPLSPSQVATTSVRVGFHVADLDAVFSAVVALGVKVVAPPADSSWGRRAVVEDLDGHPVELVEVSREPAHE
ncbi:MAG: VOC family protein [Verrucomicrobiae bacterium]|nr:VOC family protein [Verrucomicrobiae bacterium]